MLMLELVEGVGDNILHVMPRTLDSPQYIEQRVVAEFEAAHEGGWLPGHNVPAEGPGVKYCCASMWLPPAMLGCCRRGRLRWQLAGSISESEVQHAECKVL